MSARSVREGVPSRRRRDHPAITLLALVAFLLVLGSALLAHQTAAPLGASVTVKLPPATPAPPGPAFKFDR